jgi:hypothetical protein
VSRRRAAPGGGPRRADGSFRNGDAHRDSPEQASRQARPLTPEASDAALELASLARSFAIEHIGRAMTGRERAIVLHRLMQGESTVVEVRLDVPRSLTLRVGGRPIAIVPFDGELVN